MKKVLSKPTRHPKADCTHAALRYDDLAGLSVPRLKTFVCGDYSGIRLKKQEEKNLSDGM